MAPNHLPSLNNYAALLVEASRVAVSKMSRMELLASAKQYFEKAHACAPGFPTYNLACVSALQGDSSACRTWLNEAWRSGGIPPADDLNEDDDLSLVRSKPWFRPFLESVRAGPAYVFDFSGKQILYQQAEHGRTSAESSTGWAVWNAAFVLARFIDPSSGNFTPDWWQGKKVLDLSAGVGLVSCACAALGAHVVATDVGKEQLALLRRNLAINSTFFTTVPVVRQLSWGNDADIRGVLRAAGGSFDVILASDVLYIAVRDSIQQTFASTVSTLMTPSTQLVVAYEERTPKEEHDILASLGSLVEVPRERIDTRDLRASESNPEGDTMGLQMMMEEEHAIRLFLSKK